MKYAKSIQFDSIEDALTNLNAKDKGRYFLCVCPECEKKEAFIYKNNPSFIQCNRENECGERMILEYKEIESVHEIKLRQMEESYPELTKEQVESLEWAKGMFQHLQRNFKSEALDGAYRGISEEVSKKFIVDFVDEKMVQLMFHKTESLLSKAYAKDSWMCKRNLVFPIYGEDDTLDRILLRSSIDPHIEPKEIQLIMNPSKETRDFFIDIPENAKTVVISEAILDGLSFREIDRNVGVIALTGAAKTRQLQSFLKENKQLFEDKNILLALDDDKAGKKASRRLLDGILQNEIGRSVNIFEYGSTRTKDPNDLLRENRNEFKKMYQKSIGYVPKQLNKKRTLWIER